MKNLILYITPGVMSVLFTTYNKDKNHITVQGKIVKDCDGTPYANQPFTFVNFGRV